MDLVKLIAAGGLGGATFATGSLLSEKGFRRLSDPNYYRGDAYASDEPPTNPFRAFDLGCIEQKSYWYRSNSVFENKFSNYKKAQEKTSQTLGQTKPSAFNLPAPSSTSSGPVKGCFRTSFDWLDHGDNEKKTLGVRMEIALTKGKHGLVLMNHIANVKDYRVRMNSYRAIFLEFTGYWWWIKGGIQWSDEEFLKATKSANKLVWEGLKDRKEEIDWQDYTSFQDLKTESFSLFWKPDTTNGKPLYQHLTIKADPSIEPKSQDFWNGEAEPLTGTNSNYKNPYAVFVNDMWEKTPANSNVDKAKDWFNLFKDEKGVWQ